MIVTFIGHRKLQFDNGFRIQLKKLLLSLIDNRNADTFLFGSRSDFDDLCLEVVTEIQKERPGIKRVYVRAEYPYISADYEKYLLTFYDETYMPENIIHAGKAVYIERNRHMIDSSDICLFYLDIDKTTNTTCKSNTAAIAAYAADHNKTLYNLLASDIHSTIQPLN